MGNNPSTSSVDRSYQVQLGDRSYQLTHMGSNPSTTIGLRPSNGGRSYQVQLGESAVLYFRGREVIRKELKEIIGSFFDLLRVSYSVDKSRCCNVTLANTKYRYIPHKLYWLNIDIYDDAFSLENCFFRVAVRLEENFMSLGPQMKIVDGGRVLNCDACAGVTSFASSTTNERGVVTETRFYFYGSGTRLGLIIVEEKKKSKDEKPYTGIVAHYYVSTENGQNVGLSVTLEKIRFIGYGRLDFGVDGPEQHPATALIYMFDEIRRSRTWKPSYCPHCADNIIQRQRAGVWQSESESDIDDTAPAAQLHGRRRSEGNVVSNGGSFWGHNNGNTFIKYLNARK